MFELIESERQLLYYARKLLFFLSGFLFKCLLFFVCSSVFAVVLYRYVPVAVTPTIVVDAGSQLLSGHRVEIQKKWVPIEEISSYMIDAVIASEDNLFMKHSGFDFEAIKKAQEKNQKGKKLYGASTISQQTAKNVFLWQKRSWIRKGLEAYFTILIEFFWTKERIMEVYLNVIEMGVGIYGVEAASQYYYHHTAAKLKREEAAMLAVCLPGPRIYSPKKPSSYIKKRQIHIVDLMKKIKHTSWGVVE